MQYKLTVVATEDLLQIHGFGAFRFGLDQADNYLASLFEQFEKIAANPYQYPAVDYIVPGQGAVSTNHTPFILKLWTVL